MEIIMENLITLNQLDSVSCCVSCINNTPESTSTSSSKAVEQGIRREKFLASQIDCDRLQKKAKINFPLNFFQHSRSLAYQQAKAHTSHRLDFISPECRHRDLAKACDSTFVCHHHLSRVWFDFFFIVCSVYPVNIFYCYCLRTLSKRCLIFVLARFINPHMNKKSGKKTSECVQRGAQRRLKCRVGRIDTFFLSLPSSSRSRSFVRTKSIFVYSQSHYTQREWRNTHKFCCLAATEYAICHIYHRQIDSLALAQPFIKNTLDCCGFCFPSVRFAFYTPL